MSVAPVSFEPTQPSVEPSPPPANSIPTAVPLDLCVAGPHADAIRRHVEGVLGWQPVDELTAALVPPAVRLCDHPTNQIPTRRGRGDRFVPTVVILDDTATPLEVVRQLGDRRPAGVVAWPSGRDQLAAEVAAILARPRAAARGVRTLRVGGAAGGVGTTTVALTLAGLAAWQGDPTLALARFPVPVNEVRTVPLDIDGGELWRHGTALSGTGAGRVVALEPGAPSSMVVTDPAVRSVVIDAGVDCDVDVLVCRPDAAARHALERTTAAAIVVVGVGAVRPRALERAARGRRIVFLPMSARVARACAMGRVPSGLPGGWVRLLRALAPSRSQPSSGAEAVHSAGNSVTDRIGRSRKVIPSTLR